MLIWHRISIFLQEALHFIRDVEGVMGDCESRVAESGFFKHGFVFGFKELSVELLQECSVASGGQSGFFVQQRQHSEFPLNDVYARLVVGKVDECPVDLFLNILLLLKLEYVRVELIRVS